MDFPAGGIMNSGRKVLSLAGIALLLAASNICSAADDAALGRLFFSPERRTALERQRVLNIQESRSLQGATLRLNGIVLRSTGKNTVWINEQAQNEDDSPRTGISARLSSKTPGRAQLSPGDESPTELKVGEAINRATGERDTRLGGGVVITPTQIR
jgi:hypothetical protein